MAKLRAGGGTMRRAASAGVDALSTRASTREDSPRTLDDHSSSQCFGIPLERAVSNAGGLPRIVRYW
jgi:hypothetical protein